LIALFIDPIENADNWELVCALIDLADELDGDADFEPWLGAIEHYPVTVIGVGVFVASQERWGWSDTTDGEPSTGGESPLDECEPDDDGEVLQWSDDPECPQGGDIGEKG